VLVYKLIGELFRNEWQLYQSKPLDCSWLHFNRVELGYLSQTLRHATQQMVLNILVISKHKMDLYTMMNRKRFYIKHNTTIYYNVWSVKYTNIFIVNIYITYHLYYKNAFRNTILTKSSLNIIHLYTIILVILSVG
jgi:hypothetical protein